MRTSRARAFFGSWLSATRWKLTQCQQERHQRAKRTLSPRPCRQSPQSRRSGQQGCPSCPRRRPCSCSHVLPAAYVAVLVLKFAVFKLTFVTKQTGWASMFYFVCKCVLFMFIVFVVCLVCCFYFLFFLCLLCFSFLFYCLRVCLI